MISGDWDIIIKIKTKDVESAGQFVVDKLRKIEGINKVITSIVFGTAKESLRIDI